MLERVLEKTAQNRGDGTSVHVPGDRQSDWPLTCQKRSASLGIETLSMRTFHHAHAQQTHTIAVDLSHEPMPIAAPRVSAGVSTVHVRAGRVMKRVHSSHGSCYRVAAYEFDALTG